VGRGFSIARKTVGFLQRNFAATNIRRLAHVGDRTGWKVRTLQITACIRASRCYHGAHYLSSCSKDAMRVVGALVYEASVVDLKFLRKANPLLATGGIGRAYKITSNSWEYTGGRTFACYEAGAELIDMEFCNFIHGNGSGREGVMGIL